MYTIVLSGILIVYRTINWHAQNDLQVPHLPVVLQHSKMVPLVSK